ncbi:MAG: HyaD/HybD family hydrogenase maturation endopeptidase [Rhodoferax sp.]
MGELLQQPDGTQERVVVLGIGNVLWADEGFGVRCVEALEREWQFAPHVDLVDGGTQGLYLIQRVQSASKLLIFDAVDYVLLTGTLKLVTNEDVPRFMGAKKMSLHQTGFQEVLALAQLTGHYPQQVLLIGCQPEVLEDFGGSLRPSVKLAMAQALRLGLEQLQNWGAQPQRRAQADAVASTLAGAMLAMDCYELGRPSPEMACRIGDERFMPKVA